MPSTRRGLLAFLVMLSSLACEATAPANTEPVELTLKLSLAGNHDLGSTPAIVYVYTDSVPISRAGAFPQNGDPCRLLTTPVTVCTFSVPGRSQVSLVVHEPDPAVVVRLAPASPLDDARDGRYVEFTGWTDCPERPERGLCVVRATGDLTIEGSFQLMQQVSVYQTGAARMDFVTFAAAPTLKVPAQNDNILDRAGCRRVVSATLTPCDSVKIIGDTVYHRFTAYVPRQTIVGMFSQPGVGTEFQLWEGNCIPSSLYGPTVCSLISPDISGAPINITFRYTWWQCASGISDRDLGGCVEKGETAGAAGANRTVRTGSR